MALTIFNNREYVYGFMCNYDSTLSFEPGSYFSCQKGRISFHSFTFEKIRYLQENNITFIPRPLQSFPIRIKVEKNDKEVNLNYISEEILSIVYSSLCSVFQGFSECFYQIRVQKHIYVDIYLRYASLFTKKLILPLLIEGMRDNNKWSIYVDFSTESLCLQDFDNLLDSNKMLVDKHYIKPIEDLLLENNKPYQNTISLTKHLKTEISLDILYKTSFYYITFPVSKEAKKDVIY